VKNLVPSLHPPSDRFNPLKPQQIAGISKRMKNQSSFSGPLTSNGGPSYMASTESAMARARSLSIPKIRVSSH
jgi:hypothetical protein